MWLSSLGVDTGALGHMFDSQWANCGILPIIIPSFSHGIRVWSVIIPTTVTIT